MNIPRKPLDIAVGVTFLVLCAATVFFVGCPAPSNQEKTVEWVGRFRIELIELQKRQTIALEDIATDLMKMRDTEQRRVRECGCP